MVTTETTGSPVFMSGEGSSGMGSNWIWAFLLFAILGGGGFMNNRSNNAPAFDPTASGLATKDDLASQFNFSALERQNNETIAAIADGTNQTISAIKDNSLALTSTIKDSAYSNLSEVRNLESSVASGFANMQNCCCTIQRGIDSVNYNNAINTASINANTTAQTQKILDAIAADKIETLQSQVSSLQLQNAMSGVVRYPNAWTYNAGASPFCSGCGCNS